MRGFVYAIPYRDEEGRLKFSCPQAELTHVEGFPLRYTQRRLVVAGRSYVPEEYNEGWVPYWPIRCNDSLPLFKNKLIAFDPEEIPQEFCWPNTININAWYSIARYLDGIAGPVSGCYFSNTALGVVLGKKEVVTETHQATTVYEGRRVHQQAGSVESGFAYYADVVFRLHFHWRDSTYPVKFFDACAGNWIPELWATVPWVFQPTLVCLYTISIEGRAYFRGQWMSIDRIWVNECFDYNCIHNEWYYGVFPFDLPLEVDVGSVSKWCLVPSNIPRGFGMECWGIDCNPVISSKCPFPDMRDRVTAIHHADAGGPVFGRMWESDCDTVIQVTGYS